MSVEETGSLELFEGKQQEITRQELVERVSEHVNRILRRNLYELKLDEKQTFRLLRQKVFSIRDPQRRHRNFVIVQRVF